MARILIVGVTGNLGLACAVRFARKGHQVFGLSRFRTKGTVADIEQRGITPVPFDVRQDNPETLPDVDLVLLEIWNPSLLQADDPDPLGIWNLNYDGVGRIVDRYAGQADFINGSTGSIYGPADHAWQEDDWPRPTIEYGLSRLAQEKLINFLGRQRGSRTIHLRLFHANSTGGGRIQSIAQALLANTPVDMAPQQKIQVIGLEDAADFTCRAMDLLDSQPQIINLCHPKIWRSQELVERIAAELDLTDITWEIPDGSADDSYYGSAAKMVEIFGNPQQNLDQLIHKISTVQKH